MKIEIHDTFNHLRDLEHTIKKLEQVSSEALSIYLSNSLEQKECSVSLEIVKNEQIRALNLKHRNKDKETDVLSFPIFQDLRTDSSELIELPLVELGDIVISWEVLEKQASDFSISAREELIHLYIHGFLHLLGFDHEISEFEEKVMTDCEKKLLNLFKSL